MQILKNASVKLKHVKRVFIALAAYCILYFLGPLFLFMEPDASLNPRFIMQPLAGLAVTMSAIVLVLLVYVYWIFLSKIVSDIKNNRKNKVRSR